MPSDSKYKPGKILVLACRRTTADIVLSQEHQSLGGTIPPTFLGQANKTEPIKVNLQQNVVHGVVPETLAEFNDLRLLLSGNLIEVVPQAICDKKDWLDGDLELGCDGFLCPPHTFNAYGRRVLSQECKPCDFRGSSLFFGSTKCGEALAPEWTVTEVLEEVFNSAGGENWSNRDNWLTGSTNVCSWHGITCDGNQAVTRVELPENNLVGNIPSHIFFLPKLEVLNLGSNDISIDLRGTSESATLTELYIDSTNVASLEGLGQASRLQVLKMDNTPFFGKEIPDDIYALTDLQLLDLARCGFTGKIPDKIGSLSKLNSMVLSHNELSGTLPTTLKLMPQLQSLILSENSFFGTLEVVSTLPSLRTLSVSARTIDKAGLSGSLPTFDSSPKLRTLDLGGNSITGTIPSTFLSGIDASTEDVKVQLDSNILHGEIPSELGDRLEFLTIDLADNEIDGIGDGLCRKTNWQNGDVGRFSCEGLICLPGTFSKLGRRSQEAECLQCPGQEASRQFYGQTSCAQLEKVEARRILESLFDSTSGPNWKTTTGWKSEADICDWHGVTCNSDRTKVDTLVLGSNNLVGSIPADVFKLNGLKSLWLYSNPISISFNGIENASTLTSLQLDSTGLSSMAGIGAAPALREIDLRFNQIVGSLPPDLDNLSSLETLFCDGNQIGGRLPSFDRNRRLSVLRISGNLLTSELPSFTVHPSMRILDVSQNMLTGVIPPDFLSAADASKPMFVDLSDNSLQGTVPASLGRFDDATFYARDNSISGIHPDLCEKQRWNEGDVGRFGCDGIMCAPGTGSPQGRASQDLGGCTPCSTSSHFGSSCPAGDGSGATKLTVLAAIAPFMITALLAAALA